MSNNFEKGSAGHSKECWRKLSRAVCTNSYSPFSTSGLTDFELTTPQTEGQDQRSTQWNHERKWKNYFKVGVWGRERRRLFQNLPSTFSTLLCFLFQSCQSFKKLSQPANLLTEVKHLCTADFVRPFSLKQRWAKVFFRVCEKVSKFVPVRY